MFYFRKLFLLAVVICSGFLLSEKHLVQAQGGTEVGGPIISDTIWSSENSPYIVFESIDVWPDVTLTIEPGVTIKVYPEKFISVRGELAARGTKESPIVFTSNQLSPQRGDWRGLSIAAQNPLIVDGNGDYLSGSILEHCVIKYGGSDSVNGEYRFLDSVGSIMIDHCQFENNQGGAHVSGLETQPSHIRNSTIVGNVASRRPPFGAGVTGGGILIKNVILSSNTIESNVSTAGGGGIYATESLIEDNLIRYNSSNGDGGGIYARDRVTVTQNIIYGNSTGGDGGGIFTYFSLNPNDERYDHLIEFNTINNNYALSGGGGIYARNSLVKQNQVYANSARKGGGILSTGRADIIENTVYSNVINDEFGDSGGIYVGWGTSDAGSTKLIKNVVSSNGSGGITLFMQNCCTDFEVTDNIVVGNYSDQRYGFGGIHLQVIGRTIVTLTHNTIVGNEGAGLLVSQTGSFHYNTIYGNRPYDVQIKGRNNIDGTNNYWGTQETVDIVRQVYDISDDSNVGQLSYIPYLQQPDIDSPVAPPTGVNINQFSDAVTLSWDALPSDTVGYGYKIYYGPNTDFPFTGQGLSQGDSPIDAGNVSSFTITDLPIGTTYFSVTAYDNQGYESWTSGYLQAKVSADVDVSFGEHIISLDEQGNEIPVSLKPNAYLPINIKVSKGETIVPESAVELETSLGNYKSRTDDSGIARILFPIQAPLTGFNERVTGKLYVNNELLLEDVEIYSAVTLRNSPRTLSEDDARNYSSMLLENYLLRPGLPEPNTRPGSFWSYIGAATTVLDFLVAFFEVAQLYEPKQGDTLGVEIFEYTVPNGPIAYYYYEYIYRNNSVFYERKVWTESEASIQPYVNVNIGRPAIAISIASPVTVLVTNDSGKRAGYDAEAGEFIFEYPMGIGNGGDEPYYVLIPRVIGGSQYDLQLTGTDNGAYSLTVRYLDYDGSDYTISQITGGIENGEVHSYQIDYRPQYDGDAFEGGIIVSRSKIYLPSVFR